MEAKFTKGEWEIFGDWGIRAKRSDRQLADNNCHATFEYDRGGVEEGFANANLISCAPDMYNLIVELKEFAIRQGWDHTLINKAESLLSKARGEL